MQSDSKFMLKPKSWFQLNWNYQYTSVECSKKLFTSKIDSKIGQFLADARPS